MNDKRISIHEQKLWPTQLWTTRLENFCRQPRKVSENEDMINYIMSDYENNSKIIEKSLRSKELKPFLQSYEISDDYQYFLDLLAHH